MRKPRYIASNSQSSLRKVSLDTSEQTRLGGIASNLYQTTGSSQ
jgi:hypothetical protein